MYHLFFASLLPLSACLEPTIKGIDFQPHDHCNVYQRPTGKTKPFKSLDILRLHRTSINIEARIVVDNNT